MFFWLVNTSVCNHLIWKLGGWLVVDGNVDMKLVWKKREILENSAIEETTKFSNHELFSYQAGQIMRAIAILNILCSNACVQ